MCFWRFCCRFTTRLHTFSPSEKSIACSVCTVDDTEVFCSAKSYYYINMIAAVCQYIICGGSKRVFHNTVIIRAEKEKPVRSGDGQALYREKLFLWCAAGYISSFSVSDDGSRFWASPERPFWRRLGISHDAAARRKYRWQSLRFLWNHAFAAP